MEGLEGLPRGVFQHLFEIDDEEDSWKRNLILASPIIYFALPEKLRTKILKPLGKQVYHPVACTCNTCCRKCRVDPKWHTHCRVIHAPQWPYPGLDAIRMRNKMNKNKMICYGCLHWLSMDVFIGYWITVYHHCKLLPKRGRYGCCKNCNALVRYAFGRYVKHVEKCKK